LGQDPGQSSFIEVRSIGQGMHWLRITFWSHDLKEMLFVQGFTAGGFIYIAVGVLAEMNNKGNSTLKCTAIHLTSLILGMAVALCISLVE
jgi:zinc transporter 7